MNSPLQTPDQVEQEALKMMKGLNVSRRRDFNLVFWIMTCGAALGLFWALMLMYNAFTGLSVSTRVTHPEPGITCVVATASGSVAVDCWPATEQEKQNEQIQ